MIDLARETVGLVGIAVLLAMILLRVSIGVALSVVSVVGIPAILGERPAIGLLAQIPYDFTAHWTLSSIPMLLFMGYRCDRAGPTTGLFRLARLWLSRLPGGLSIASIQGSALLAAVTGSSLACTAATGGIAVPATLDCGYDQGWPPARWRRPARSAP